MTMPSNGNPIMLDMIDGCPIQEDELSFALKSWLSVLADTINSTFQEIQDEFNVIAQFGISVPGFSPTEITALATGAPIGTLFYDTTNDEWVGLTASGLVKFTTTSWP